MSFKRIVVTPPLSVSTWAAPPTMIVLHATAGATARSSVDHLRSVGLSYHFIIARDGKDSAKTAGSDGSDPIVYFCVPMQNRAAHVGSKIPMPASGNRIANHCAIGISLANRQNGEPYAPKQIAVLDELIDLVKSELPTVTHLTTHAVIQPWNRADPRAIDGSQVAARHGLHWFKPTQQQIGQHTPPKTKKV